MKLPALLDVLNGANRQQLVLIEAHSHPFASNRVDFSAVDAQGQKEMVAYLADVQPGQPYGALVFGQHAVRGILWNPGSSASVPLNRIVVTGASLAWWSADGTVKRKRGRHGSAGKDEHSRQVLALGAAGQDALANVSVAVVGLGGLGSVVAQELAHLGVRRLVLVDDDLVEASNLSRLVGASLASVGEYKVDVAQASITRTTIASDVQAMRMNVRELAAIDAVTSADIVFGCVDTDAGRMILNEAALAYLIPYIDCGVGINVTNRRITEAGGRVITWIPGRPCLVCCREIDPHIAAEELESPEQQEFRRIHGYVSGAVVPEPSVISLNATVASLAVTEFLALVTGIKPSQHYTYYDMLEQRVGPRLVSKNDKCTACGIEGLGLNADLGRYAVPPVPQDLPV